jgi:polygalacturonase
MKSFFTAIFILVIGINVKSQITNLNWYNVKDFGATGNGQSDDSEFIQQAINLAEKVGGVIYFPPGHYLTNTIVAPSHVTFMGNSSWGYDDETNGNTIISPLNDSIKYLFNLEGCKGTRIVGITLFGNNLGNGMHGIYSKHDGNEQNIVIDDCNIHDFSGSGIRLENVWVFAIRRSLIKGNKSGGIDASGSYDGWIIDNQITANGKGGILGTSFATVTITANRIEWNQGGGIVLKQGAINTIQIDNCTFDRNFGPGIAIVKPVHSFAIAINGNIFRRNGFKQDSTADSNCHVHLESVRGLTFTGNTLFGGNHDRDLEIGNRPASPNFGLVIGNLIESVISNNSMYHAALNTLIVNKEGHSNLILKDNPGSLQEPFGID